MAAADEAENLVLKLLGEMRGQISALDTKLTNRIDTLDSKLDGLPSRVDALTLRIDRIENRLSRLERVVEGLGDSIDVVLKNLRALLATHDPDRLDKIEQRLAALERAMVGGSSS
jgi:hypothetical protein